MADIICRFPSVSDDRPEPRAQVIDLAASRQARASALAADPAGIKESIRLSILMLELALAHATTMSERIEETATKEEVDQCLSIVGELLEFIRTEARRIPIQAGPAATNGLRTDRHQGSGVE